MTDYGIVRVSSEEQSTQGLSIEIQIQELLKPNPKYPDKNIKTENIFKAEGYSGGFKTSQLTTGYNKDTQTLTAIFSLKDRPDLNNILTLIKPGDRIYFKGWDRLGRNISFIETITRHCTENHIQLCPLEESQEEIERLFRGMFGQLERNRTIQRLDYIHKGRYEQGITPYKASYGYKKNIKDNKGKLRYPKQPEGNLIIDEPKATIVRECFKTAIESKETGNNTLYRKLCDKHEIKPAQYYKILRNKAYTGQIQHKGEWKKTGKVPQIISEEDFNKVNS